LFELTTCFKRRNFSTLCALRSMRLKNSIKRSLERNCWLFYRWGWVTVYCRNHTGKKIGVKFALEFYVDDQENYVDDWHQIIENRQEQVVVSSWSGVSAQFHSQFMFQHDLGDDFRWFAVKTFRLLS
jgi:hypothetical protein